ncbi:MAG TPA: hypothetical protein VE377_10070 [Candidatus Dormibacteraeota bacterium]|nr:hypothetical protein [Candidatus Dormibacteraeota bacterium]
MFGRRGACLLAVSWLALSPIWLIGQSSRAGPTATAAPDSAPDLASDFVLRLGKEVQKPPLRDPSLRVPSTLPGVSGFPQFARAAGMIFSGTVARVERRAATLGQSVETVAITFHVENAIRGTTPGENLTISQWIGLWSSGQRYRVGERVLLFLYPNGKLGLTSWVGGPLGRLAVDSGGRVLLTAQHMAAFRRDPVLGGKSRLRISDFALAVRRAGEEE